MNRVGAGVTLRHWTTDSVSFKGGRERPSSALSGFADSRRLNQVASMLKKIQAPRALPSRRPA